METRRLHTEIVVQINPPDTEDFPPVKRSDHVAYEPRHYALVIGEEGLLGIEFGEGFGDIGMPVRLWFSEAVFREIARDGLEKLDSSRPSAAN